MLKNFVETLLFASVSVNAALLMFFAGVYRKMMNEINVTAFKSLTEMLVRYSSKSPFMILVLSLPLIIAIPYYYFNGFGNWWITASLVLWLVAGSVAKALKLPVYKNISALSSDDIAGLNEMRHKLNQGNSLQAVLYVIAVILMAAGLMR